MTLDRFVVPHGSIYLVHDSAGKVIGQLHPRNTHTYVASALCQCDHHVERCSRTRSWNIGREPVEAVQRVLVKRLHDAHGIASTQLHMDEKRA